MSLIITFMFEPAKLQMNWARASGRRNFRLAAPTSSGIAGPTLRWGFSVTWFQRLHKGRGGALGPTHGVDFGISRHQRCLRGRSSSSLLGVRCSDSGRRADQGEMAERLREVPDLSLPSHVVLFGQQAEIVGQADEPLEQGTRLRDSAGGRERADQPERAGEELSLVAGEPVVGVGGRVARDEAVSAEVARDRIDRGGDPLVGARKEPHERDGEDARVEPLGSVVLVGSVVLGKGAPLAVVALFADLAVDLVAGLLPAVQRRFQTELLADSNRTVEHDPGHDLGVREVATRSAGLPDAVVGLTPDRLDVVDDRPPTQPASHLDPADDRRAEETDREDLAVNVELGIGRAA